MEVENVSTKSGRDRDDEATGVLDSFGLGDGLNIFSEMEASLTADVSQSGKKQKTETPLILDSS